ncbi:MAG: NAD kinase [Pseudomonadota bacterium]
MRFKNLSIEASDAPDAQAACRRLRHRYGHAPRGEADCIVALGGDGFMLQTLHQSMAHRLPVYGMNRGTVGFLMNNYAEDGLLERLAAAKDAVINPLRMTAQTPGKPDRVALAINEVALLRETRQAAKLRVWIDGEVQLDELICDGVMLATPAGSTAYNHSAHGPIIPIRARLLALTPVAVFRPRRWRGALLPYEAEVRIDILDQFKRPVSATADHVEVRDAGRVDIALASDIDLHLLHDPGQSLEDRVIREQFSV